MKFRVTLGVGQEKERLQTPASLSLASLSLWLKTEIPRSGQGRGNLCVEVNRWFEAPRKILPRRARLINPKDVDVNGNGNEPIVRVGSRHSLEYPKNNGPLDVLRYGTKAPDEFERRDNPGNEQASPANGGGVPVNGIRASVINLLSKFQTSPFTKQQWLSLVNAKRQPPLWKKLSFALAGIDHHRKQRMGLIQ